MIPKINDEIIEYDKRIGVPNFKGWGEREIEAFNKRGLTIKRIF